ncbi:GTPase required for pre-60S ribosomal subunit nuclear export and maturation [Irineochytrium annulatum]|nr:GTPase required for pre-60S ribosomal subunit nuclear export and maturation [Irineochytrium annulatum]
MGRGKNEKNRVAKTAASSGTGTSQSLKNVTHVKGTNFYRDAKAVKQLNMLKSGKPTRDTSGKIIKAAAYQSRLAPGTQARVQSDRRWFENTRVVGMRELEGFREKMGEKANDPYTVLLRQNKLPMSLLVDNAKTTRMHLLETDPFSNTFGPKAQRKKPKLSFSTTSDLADSATTRLTSYSPTADAALLANISTSGAVDEARDPVFTKGQSKRIWSELYKVIDSSDVIIHVLDARDPMGTRCKNVENYIRKEVNHKHLIFILNKCDLVPTWVTAKWVAALSREYPTLAFHASITNSFGKGSLIQLLRQFSTLHSDKKQISVGFIGYPNTGKSSIINTLRAKKVCNVAPIPGETKVWQYITLMKRIYLIDCPGVVHPSSDDSETDIVLKGVVRVENIKTPEDHIPAILERVRDDYIRRTYDVERWDDHWDLLAQVAKRSGKLLKGAEPDTMTVAKMILNDWLRGRIPYFAMPPEKEGGDEEAGEEKREGPGVEQIFSKIPVSTKFLPDDLRDRDAPAAAATEAATATVEGDVVEGKESDGSAKENVRPVVDWDELLAHAGEDEDEDVASNAAEGVVEGADDGEGTGEGVAETLEDVIRSIREEVEAEEEAEAPAKTEMSKGKKPRPASVVLNEKAWSSRNEVPPATESAKEEADLGAPQMTKTTTRAAAQSKKVKKGKTANGAASSTVIDLVVPDSAEAKLANKVAEDDVAEPAIKGKRKRGAEDVNAVNKKAAKPKPVESAEAQPAIEKKPVKLKKGSKVSATIETGAKSDKKAAVVVEAEKEALKPAVDKKAAKPMVETAKPAPEPSATASRKRKEVEALSAGGKSVFKVRKVAELPTAVEEVKGEKSKAGRKAKKPSKAPEEPSEDDVKVSKKKKAVQEVREVKADKQRKSAPVEVAAVDADVVVAKKATKSKAQEKTEVFEDDFEDSKKSKSKRMTTNKGKVGRNFYDEVNVKGKRKSKAAVLTPAALTKRMRRAGTTRPQK